MGTHQAPSLFQTVTSYGCGLTRGRVSAWFLTSPDHFILKTQKQLWHYILASMTENKNVFISCNTWIQQNLIYWVKLTEKEVNNERCFMYLPELYVNKLEPLGVWWMFRCVYISILHTFIRLVFPKWGPWRLLAGCCGMLRFTGNLIQTLVLFLMRPRSLLRRVLTRVARTHRPLFVRSVKIPAPRHNSSQSLRGLLPAVIEIRLRFLSLNTGKRGPLITSPLIL